NPNKQSFSPYETETYNLGTSSYRWKGVYTKDASITGTVNLSGLTGSSLLQLDSSKNVISSNVLDNVEFGNEIRFNGAGTVLDTRIESDPNSDTITIGLNNSGSNGDKIDEDHKACCFGLWNGSA